MKSLSKKELKELLIKCWMTHDAMWFYHCLQECGIEQTNRVNKAAVTSMATIEIERFKKALGIEKVETFEELKELIEGALGIVKADFMHVTIGSRSQNVLRCEMHQCFAYDGIKQMGVIDQYHCGMLPRVEAWLDSLGLEYSVTPQVDGCMMHTDGNCFREYTFRF